jgi:hypothetical protein
MSRCRVDPELARTVIDGFAFPLGVYPIEPMRPLPGYIVEFEPADAGVGGEEGQFEEWPDRYVFEVVISAERLEPLCRSLLGLFAWGSSRGASLAGGGGRVYPIVDYLGHDQYREVDPYISYDLIGADRFLDAIRRYRGFFFEDGLCGVGAMIDEPFLYIFIDEHKIVTIRCEPHRREKVERILQAFDLELLTPANPPAGADAAAHEHRTIMVTADDRPDLLTADEIIETLRDEWNLVLNVDPEANLDEEGRELGVTPWRCLVRVGSEEPLDRPGGESQGAAAGTAGESGGEPPSGGDREPGSESADNRSYDRAAHTAYIDVVLTAGSLRAAEEMAMDAADEMAPEGMWDEATVVFADRVRPEMIQEFIRTHQKTTPENSRPEERIIWTGWLE